MGLPNYRNVNKRIVESSRRRLRRERRRLGANIYTMMNTDRIDLSRTLVSGEGGFTAGRWADLTGNMRRASSLLASSVHVQLLEQYINIGEELLASRKFRETPYFKNASDCVRITGGYFGHTTFDGIQAQARAFISLHKRLAAGDCTEVAFPRGNGHSEQGSLPVVQKTWTPGTVEIIDGQHRLAISWVLGRKHVKAVVKPSEPTELQSLVSTIAQTGGRKELYQPIEGPEFDDSWALVRRCHDRLSMMLKFLKTDVGRTEGLTIADLACSYGWFTSEFAKRKNNVVGIDSDPAALRIGKIAYGLSETQLIRSELTSFLSQCSERFDVVLCFSILHHFGMKPDFGAPAEILRKLDGITDKVLFLDAGQAHEQWFKDSLPDWDEKYLVELIKGNTTFTEVVPLGIDSDNVPPYEKNYGRTLFACFRS